MLQVLMSKENNKIDVIFSKNFHQKTFHHGIVLTLSSQKKLELCENESNEKSLEVWGIDFWINDAIRWKRSKFKGDLNTNKKLWLKNAIFHVWNQKLE